MNEMNTPKTPIMVPETDVSSSRSTRSTSYNPNTKVAFLILLYPGFISSASFIFLLFHPFPPFFTVFLLASQKFHTIVEFLTAPREFQHSANENESLLDPLDAMTVQVRVQVDLYLMKYANNMPPFISVGGRALLDPHSKIQFALLTPSERRVL